MRLLPARGQLDDYTKGALRQKSSQVSASSTPKVYARREYDSSRGANWFAPVVKLLRIQSGTGGCCMWCSSGESSHVDHYRPLAKFPELAFVFENFLWSCAICNTRKGNRFDNTLPPINPIDENPWDFFFVDDLGLLVVRADIDERSQRRARETIKMVGLDRDELDARRRSALKKLRLELSAFLATSGTPDAKQWVRERLDEEVHQPDVVQYFLSGPGRAETPFSSLAA